MLPTRVDPTYTAYSVTPTLSVAAGHARVIAVGVLDEAVRVAGAVGGVVSPVGGGVVAAHELVAVVSVVPLERLPDAS